MKINIIYDEKRDLGNWESALSTPKSQYGISWLEKLPQDFDTQKIKDSGYIVSYIQSNFIENGKIKTLTNSLVQLINVDQIKKDLEDISGHPVNWNSVNAYITTFNRAPYNYENKLIYIVFQEDRLEKVLRTIYHELFHFIFHERYWNGFKKLGYSENKIHDIKESLTVVLNPTLKFKSLPLDNGYPKHQALREKILNSWTTDPNLDHLIEWLKKTIPKSDRQVPHKLDM